MDDAEFWDYIKSSENPHIIFICLGNICRSPYAEFKFKQLLSNSHIRKKDQITVSSAGFIYQDRIKIYYNTKKALMEEKINEKSINLHTPRVFSDYSTKKLENAALIVMSSEHRDLEMEERFRKKAILLSALATEGEEIDIPDPYMIDDYYEYKKILEKIKGYLLVIIKKMELLEI